MPKLTLREFQVEDVDLVQEHDYRAIIANAPGTGKTIECLECLNRDRKKLTPALVVCPSSVVTHWVREARRWCPWARVQVVSGRSSPLPRRKPDIMVLPWALLAHRVAEALALAPGLVVADEAHYAKAASALRSQALARVVRRCDHLLLLTGTPIINTHHELGALQGLYGDRPPVMIRRLIEDVAPDIPPKTRSEVPVSLRPADQARYQRVEDDFAKWLSASLRRRLSAGEARAAAHRSLAAEALVKIGYLRRFLARAKVPAAADWIARAVRLGEPVVVFCEHRDVVAALQALLKRQRLRFVTVDGSTPRKQRQVAIDRFQGGEVPVFLGTRAAKEGITLTRARNLLFVERYYTSADEEQAEDRIRRIGQTHPTTIWFLHAPGTVDDRLAAIIGRKRRIVRTAVGAADIAESDQATVLELISTWDTHVGEPADPTALGAGDRLPALPNPWLVCKLMFKGKRWTSSAARGWARMNGYAVCSVSQAGAVVKVMSQSPASFTPGTFQAVSLCEDVQAVVGKRKLRKAQRVDLHSTRKSGRRKTRVYGQ